jgi:putative hydrolase
MILTADYHTHTKYSHGKGTVLENALSAKELGLKEIAITDHGFSHPAFGLRKRKLPSLIEDCRLATEETGVKTLVGVESNLISDKGKTDLPVKLYDKFDIFLMGIHKFVTYTPPTFFKLFVPNQFCSMLKKEPSKRLIAENTKAVINAIKNNPIDILTHLNFVSYTDAVEVAKCASDYGTYIELNSKKQHLSDEEIFKVVQTGVNFVIDSDAHSPSRVGEISLVANMLARVEVPLDRIFNIDGKTPDFRFKRFKEGK